MQAEALQPLLRHHYGLNVLAARHADEGAGSDTWFVTCAEGTYVVKYPAASEINHPEQEPELCQKLLDAGIPVCRFLRNRDGQFITTNEAGRLFHVQAFIDGRTYDLNTAPDWLLTESAALLGRIHTALRDDRSLPVGIGKDFFRFMTPESALASYQRSLEKAHQLGDASAADDLAWRIGLVQRMPHYFFDLDALTCQSTHGDYFISQLICDEQHIAAVIDWTTACVHPVVWEIIRSYVYASPACRDGHIDIPEFLRYVSAYRRHAPLNEADLRSMAPLFFYQLAVCDYYAQYYASDAHNRHIYRHQAEFSTRLMVWLEQHMEELTAGLLAQKNC